MSLYKLRDLLRDRNNRPLRCLWLALVTITLSLTMQPIAPRLDQLAGTVDVARIMSNCLTLVSATAAQVFLLYMTGDDEVIRRRVPRWMLTLAGCVVLLVALFLLTPSPYAVSDPYVRSGEYYAATATAT